MPLFLNNRVFLNNTVFFYCSFCCFLKNFMADKSRLGGRPPEQKVKLLCSVFKMLQDIKAFARKFQFSRSNLFSHVRIL